METLIVKTHPVLEEKNLEVRTEKTRNRRVNSETTVGKREEINYKN